VDSQRHGGTAATAGKRVYLPCIFINNILSPKLSTLRKRSLFVWHHYCLTLKSTSAHRYNMLALYHLFNLIAGRFWTRRNWSH